MINKQTRFYQEVKQEEKLEVLSRMLDLGLDLETIAQATDLPIEVVREEANKKQRSRFGKLFRTTLRPKMRQ